jgi:hypothetical protein
MIQHTWRLMYTKARQEKAVSRRLEAKGFETFLPLLIARRQWSDRIQKVEMPLYPGVLFARIPDTPEAATFASNTPGIAFGLRFAKVAEDDIKRVRQVLSGYETSEAIPVPAAGERVRVIGDGEPLEGIVLESGATCRVAVPLLREMGTAAVIQVPRTAVQPV